MRKSNPSKTFKCRLHRLYIGRLVIRVEGYYLNLPLNDGSTNLEPALNTFSEDEARAIIASMETNWTVGLSSLQQIVTTTKNPTMRGSIHQLLSASALPEVWNVFQRLSDSPDEVPERLEELDYKSDLINIEPRRGQERYDIGTSRTAKVDVTYLEGLLNSLGHRIFALADLINGICHQHNSLAISALSYLSTIVLIIQYNRDSLCHVRSPGGSALLLPFSRFLETMTSFTLQHHMTAEAIYEHGSMADHHSTRCSPGECSIRSAISSKCPNMEMTQKQHYISNKYSESTAAPASTVGKSHNISVNKSNNQQPVSTTKSITKEVYAESSLGESLDSIRYNNLLSSCDPERSYLAPRLCYASEKSVLRTAYTSKISGFHPPQWKQLHIFPEQHIQWESFRLDCMYLVLVVANRYNLNEATLHDAWKLSNVVFFESLRSRRRLDDAVPVDCVNSTLTLRQKILYGIYVSVIMSIKVNDRELVFFDLASSRTSNRERIKRYFLSMDTSNAISQPSSHCDEAMMSQRTNYSTTKSDENAVQLEWESTLLNSLPASTPLEYLERQIEICEFPDPCIVYKRSCYILARCYLTPGMNTDVPINEISTAAMYAAVYTLRRDGLMRERHDRFLKAAKIVQWNSTSVTQCCEECYTYFLKYFQSMSPQILQAFQHRFSPENVFFHEHL